MKQQFILEQNCLIEMMGVMLSLYAQVPAGVGGKVLTQISIYNISAIYILNRCHTNR